MTKQCFNPFLPSYEYIPDAEPHVFGDRVYIYGSHDKFNGKFFCMNDYVCYSAPVTDLSDWRYEGVIWLKQDDPLSAPWVLKQLYAPDVVQGTDGRYYLYYFKGNSGVIGVAVCDTPCGKYSYYGHVRYPDGTLLGKKHEKDFWQFDPGAFRDDDGKVYLYTGFAPKSPNIFTRFRPVNSNGAMGVELCEDMLTVKTETIAHIARSQHNSAGSGYEGNEFFEASSMRKFNGRYYFIYSSVNGHELCYAVGDKPLGNFTYGGVLVSIGDVGLSLQPTNYLGNTHGSVECIDGKYYVFYHRQTNRHCHSRQACAEEIQLLPNGKFVQAEVTSCGLNGGPLLGKGRYEARIACNLTSANGVTFYTAKMPAGKHPYFTQSGGDREYDGDQYIANICDGTMVGFKYFAFSGAQTVAVEVGGNARGKFVVTDGERVVAEVSVNGSGKFVSTLTISDGTHPLFFTYHGKGRCNMTAIELA